MVSGETFVPMTMTEQEAEGQDREALSRDGADYWRLMAERWEREALTVGRELARLRSEAEAQRHPAT